MVVGVKLKSTSSGGVMSCAVVAVDVNKRNVIIKKSVRMAYVFNKF
jgi:hypothetical protein